MGHQRHPNERNINFNTMTLRSFSDFFLFFLLECLPFFLYFTSNLSEFSLSLFKLVLIALFCTLFAGTLTLIPPFLNFLLLFGNSRFEFLTPFVIECLNLFGTFIDRFFGCFN
jgi:hypothetical protein